ncbi:hypothetical protein AWH62_11445 [Maricaulis sp. W15]|uniref:DUF4164 family protein n=1 Tax=Maricaulis sp. W15 TaxID=1772333 RepID=UPI000948A7D0|nr:DUF4164 family protein [Maricaulis sp. W15]OLF71746.1 hypothetical protein AWH62_11445 [Maricaulis sp. W15]
MAETLYWGVTMAETFGLFCHVGQTEARRGPGSEPSTFPPLFTVMNRSGVKVTGGEVEEELELWADAADSGRMNVRSDMPEDALEVVLSRLDNAMGRVEGVARTMRARVRKAEIAAVEARDADVDRANLAEALDEARGREAVLQDAAQSASDALDSAISDLRGLLTEEG